MSGEELSRHHRGGLCGPMCPCMSPGSQPAQWGQLSHREKGQEPGAGPSSTLCCLLERSTSSGLPVGTPAAPERWGGEKPSRPPAFQGSKALPLLPQHQTQWSRTEAGPEAVTQHGVVLGLPLAPHPPFTLGAQFRRAGQPCFQKTRSSS